MTGGMGVTGAKTVVEELKEFSGQPLRLTVLDAGSRERIARVSGVLTQVTEAQLVVDCLYPVAVPPSGVPVTVELWARGSTVWCHTHTLGSGDGDRTRLLLRAPAMVQTQQRRRFPRVDLDLPIQVDAGAGMTGAILRDLSAGGASVELSTPVATGECVRMLLNLRTRLFCHELQAEVLRCTPVAGKWIAALRFACNPEEEMALAAFVERQSASRVPPG